MSRGWPPMMTLAVTASTSSQLQDKQKESTVNRSDIGHGSCHTQEDALVVCMPIDCGVSNGCVSGQGGSVSTGKQRECGATVMSELKIFFSFRMLECYWYCLGFQ